MCLSNNPEAAVDFRRTTLVGLEVQGVGADGKPINQRILGYSNVMAIPRAVVASGVATASDATSADAAIAASAPAVAPGNAMLFAVPAAPGLL